MLKHYSARPRAALRPFTAPRLLAVALIAGSVSLAEHRIAIAAGDLPTASPEGVGLSSKNLAAATALLKKHVGGGKVAGVVAAIMRKGKLVYFEKIGYQNLAQKTPMRNDTIFQIRSMSKPITGVAVMILVERGKLKLDDPVSKYLPEFKSLRVFNDAKKPDIKATHPTPRAVTIEDLLLHTSGLNHRFSKLYRTAKVRSRAEPLPVLVKKVTALPLMNDPGTTWRYSIATTVLGRVVEVASGQPFDAFLEENIFKPLGMTHTGFYVKPAQAKLLATAYALPKGSDKLKAPPPEKVPFTQKPALLEGAAGIATSARDYLRFSQMLLNKGELDGTRILKAETVAAMTRNHLPAAVLPMRIFGRPVPGLGWGYNVAVVMDKTKFRYQTNNGEYFWAGSLGTRFWIDPKTETVTLFMAQIRPSFAGGLAFKWKSIATKDAKN